MDFRPQALFDLPASLRREDLCQLVGPHGGTACVRAAIRSLLSLVHELQHGDVRTFALSFSNGRREVARNPHTKASEARARLTNQLRTSGSLDTAVLARILSRCTKAHRCRSAACPLCKLDFQQVGVSTIDEFIRIPAREIRNRMTFITIVPGNGCLPPDDLTAEACDAIASQITASIAMLRLPPAVIGFEVSFNEDLTGELPPHWCLHGHAHMRDWLSQDQKKALRDTFPPSDFVKRPIRCDLLDQRINARLYPFKPEAVRRVSFLDTSDPTRNPFRDSKARNLRPAQAVALALVEHERGFAGRILTHEVDERAVRRHLEGLGWARDGP
jgi:hypothetical protein